MLEKIPRSIGEGLRSQRAGIEHTVIYRLDRRELPRIEVLSAAFAQDGHIPLRYTADGSGISPPLRWSGVPQTTASIALIVEDADSPTPHPLVHAIVVNMGVDDGALDEGAINSPDHEGWALQVGRNSFLRQSWLPPDPPPGHGLHRYVFQVFCLGVGEPFSAVPGRQEIFDAVNARALAGGYLIGQYGRGDKVLATADAAHQTAEEINEPDEPLAAPLPA
jgi:Raf kinase inhibitor-like YbhB/YbcL family protein